MKAALILVLLGALSVSRAQQPQRDATGALAAADGSIAGVVLEDATTGIPIHGVAVTLRGPSLGAGRLAVTDADGKFVFPKLSPGNFTIEAVCSGFVRTFFGSAVLGKGPGLAIAVGSGQTVQDVTLRMIRGGVISGVVRDAYAQPQANAEVTLIPVSRGMPELGRTIVFKSDEMGRYRAYGLTPGPYLIAVQPGFNYNGSTLYSRQQLDDLIAGRSSPPMANTDMIVRAGYAPVYFPGATAPQGATAIAVKPGEEVAGIDIALQFVRMTRLEGRVIAPTGTTLKDVELRIELQGDAGLELRTYAGTTPGPGSIMRVAGGTFQRAALVPGRYVLTATGSTADASGTASLWGRAELEASGQSVVSVVVDLQRSMTVAGSVDVIPSGNVPNTRVLLRSTDNAAAALKRAPLGANGSFVFQDVPPGRYWIDTEFAGEGGWRVVDARVGLTSLLDTPLSVGAGQDVTGIRATLSNQASLRGRLVDSVGRLTAGYVIVVFSSDKAHWASERRVTVVKPASDGQYVVAALPPGEYLICAAPDADPIDLRDPAYLEVASQSALKIGIGLGKTVVLDLQIPARLR
jgi:hypothetical protein